MHTPKKPEQLKSIPEPTLRRIPVYYQYLKQKQADRISQISSTTIAADLNLVPIQVRKDLALLGAAGKPKTGFEIHELLGAIEETLGWNNTDDAFLIGAGNLGAALLGYEGFQDYGLNIAAAFDSDPAKAGTWIHDKEVLDIRKLPELVERMKVKIGILTVPNRVAQETCDLLVGAGIRAIWNFTPTHINVPAHVIVQHENLASSLAVLSRRLDDMMNHKRK